MKKKTKLTIAAAAAGLLAAIAVPLAALAYPPTGWDRTYYDDALHTNNVGFETMYCTGKKHLWWGTVTPYFDEDIIEC